MSEYKRVLTALDLSDKDQQVLNFSNFLMETFESKQAYFLHIIPDFNLPKNLDLEFHKKFAPTQPVDEKVSTRLKEDIRVFCPSADKLETHVEVIEGQPYQKLIHWLDVKSIDLLVVGNKAQSEGSGITPKRVARKASSSICYVGEKAGKKVQRILVGVDFSDYSLRALQAAALFQKKYPDVEVTAMNLIPIPSTVYDINQNYLQLRDVLFSSTKEHMEEFLKENGLSNINIKYEMNDYFDISLHLQKYADANDIDMIILGAKGHSPFENFLYGSVSEKLVSRETNASIMIVR